MDTRQQRELRAQRWKIVALALCVAAVAGCVHKIVMRPGRISTGAGFDADSGRLLDAKTKFRVGDKQVVAWAEFENAYGNHAVRFRWFNPADQLVLDSGPVRITPDDELYKVRRVWSVLPVKGTPAQLMPGKWHVDVLLDGKRIERLKFKVK